MVCKWHSCEHKVLRNNYKVFKLISEISVIVPINNQNMKTLRVTIKFLDVNLTEVQNIFVHKILMSKHKNKIDQKA